MGQRGTGATATEPCCNSNCNGNCNGNGDRISIVMQRRRGNGDGDRWAGALGHWGTGALGQEQQQLQLQWQWQWGNDRSCFISQHKTSTIVVGESVQTVWLTNIPDVLCCD
jgi:hypothetical protein